jgi:formamidopyrimidine-DNA glycosylase
MDFFSIPQSLVRTSANHHSSWGAHATKIHLPLYDGSCPKLGQKRGDSVPELPDIVVYIEALQKRVLGQTLEAVRVISPFLLRTANPPLADASGKKVLRLRRLGKRICIGLEDDLWLVLHLMIAGRLHWRPAAPNGARPKASPPRGLAAFDFAAGSLLWTEAGSQKRASLHVVTGEAGLSSLDPGGLEVLDAAPEQFAAKLLSANHTLKRALTDPRLFSGIGNAYSDEILWEAKLSPLALTQKLSVPEIKRLFEAIRSSLTHWTDRLRSEAAGKFPEKVTAFREGMAVHGRYKLPCPRCGSRIQRIRYASNKTNYCPTCQTAGKLLADRALSRLLHEDWPRSLDELELLTSKSK